MKSTCKYTKNKVINRTKKMCIIYNVKFLKEIKK